LILCAQAIGNNGNSQENQRRHNRKIKKLPKKPFTELLKHLESANTAIPQGTITIIMCVGLSDDHA